MGHEQLRLIFAALFLASCVAASDPPPPQTLEEYEAAIQKEIGTPKAGDVAQCRVLGFGAKPCGGPWRYLVYSTATSDEPRLQALVEEYNRLDRKRNEEEQRGSDCMAVARPDVAIADGVCVAVSGRSR